MIYVLQCTCHPERNEVESKDLRSIVSLKGVGNVQILRLALLAQDDRIAEKSIKNDLLRNTGVVAKILRQQEAALLIRFAFADIGEKHTHDASL